MSGVQGNFRVPSILTAEAFAKFDARFSVLCLHDRGVLLVADEQDGKLLTYHAFKKLYGTLGALFLASDRKRVHARSYLAHLAACSSLAKRRICYPPLIPRPR